jgi:hypothetical protein
MFLNIATTYQIVTPESAEHGDIAEHGFVINGVCFPFAGVDVDPYEPCTAHEALLAILSNGVEHVEAHGNSVRVYGHPRADFRTGDSVTYCVFVRGDARLIRALVKAVRS